MRWDKADIPHKGWQYVGMEDLGEDVYHNAKAFLLSGIYNSLCM